MKHLQSMLVISVFHVIGVYFYKPRCAWAYSDGYTVVYVCVYVCLSVTRANGFELL